MRRDSNPLIVANNRTGFLQNLARFLIQYSNANAREYFYASQMDGLDLFI